MARHVGGVEMMDKVGGAHPIWLRGRNAWRIRVGDYRVLYEIHDARLLILVVDIGHRREIYR
jgi:mRNA-degrading endonuclease RelE of RelBE toxin-antitoxin system